MSIYKTVRDLRKSQSLSPISIYCKEAAQSLPNIKDFFKEITPTLKLILKAFKLAGFSIFVSNWGGLFLFSPALGIEVFVKIEPNIRYMAKSPPELIKQKGYDVKDVQLPPERFVLKYFFCGTKSKWRHIYFNTALDSVDMVYSKFIEQIIKESRPFQGRHDTSLEQKTKENFLSKNSIYAFALFAKKHASSTIGLNRLSGIFESTNVNEFYIGGYGAVILTNYSRSVDLVQWFKNDVTFLKKYLPEVFKQHEISCKTLKKLAPNNEEHQFMVEALDAILLKQLKSPVSADEYLNEHLNFNKEQPIPNLLGSTEGVIKILSLCGR
ncbi:hypothetical protein [Glaciecola sp. 1036]|uniref:hypothetical protein n=1 Tax=Alteromonadaceae TaxID=72275 RepID=UPI003CFBCC52